MKIHCSRLLMIVLMLFSVCLGMAQTGGFAVKGNVSDANGPLVGANVSEKGGNNATISDASGNFKLQVSDSKATLLITYVGYDTLELPVNGKNFLSASLQPVGRSLSGVVVTALGITRSKKSLGYDVGQINGDDLNRVAQTNVLNGMAGKVSGVSVSSTGSSPTSSVSIVIRGTRSLNSDNQPLFVVDGVPVKNSLSNVGVNGGGGNDVDYGNTISDINPDDIESVSILKGPSAAALYGARAGNGVVLITTKSGKKSKGIGVTFNSNTEAAVPYHYLPLNRSYTIGHHPYDTPNGSNSLNGVLVDAAGTDTYRFGTPLDIGLKAIQWNSKMDANGNYIPEEMVSYNNLKNFVQTGLTSTNSVSIENSTDKDNYRFSYTNMSNRGIIPTTGLTRHNISFNLEHKITKALRISSVINYARSSSDNVVAGNDGVLKDVAYLSPSVDIREMKDYWLTPGIQQRKVLPPVGTDLSPDLLDPSSDGDDNPWFKLHQVKNSFLRNHLLGNIKLTYDINPHWSAFVRYAQDLFYDNRESKISKSYTNERNGYYSLTNVLNTESNTDFLATYHNTIHTNFDLTASGGGNIQYVYGTSQQTYSARGGGIIAPEFFNISNISQDNIRYASGYSQKAVYSLYGMASLGYKGMAYLDVTGRNDWSSTLPAGQNSYFYPSASLSLLLNKMFDLGKNVSILKLRGGWAKVGKDTDPYNLYGTVAIGSYGGIVTESASGTLKNPGLKPEEAVSTEIGVDLGMFSNRLRFEGTIYRSDNKNQILSINTPGSSGYTGRQINAGLVRSQGIELSLGGTIIAKRDWTWDLKVNYTHNDAYVISLANGVNYFSFWQDGRSGSWVYAKGQPIPNAFDSKGNQVISDGKLGALWDNQVATVTDKSSKYYGFPLLDNDGFYQAVGNGDFAHKELVGNFNPKLQLGIQTSLKWKMLTLDAAVDMRLGGIFFSQTYRYLSSDAAMKWQETVGMQIPEEYRNNIPAYLLSNPEAYIIQKGLQQFHLVGGPNAAKGGFPYEDGDNGITFSDGAFYPGVYSDGNGGYIENLGDPATTKYDFYEDAVTGGWNFARMSMFDASYIKLRELTLSAQLPKRWASAIKAQSLSFGVYTRNVIIWTKAKAGIDPEMAFQFQQGRQGNGSQFRQGIERYNITPWTLPLGVKLNVRF